MIAVFSCAYMPTSESHLLKTSLAIHYNIEQCSALKHISSGNTPPLLNSTICNTSFTWLYLLNRKDNLINLVERKKKYLCSFSVNQAFTVYTLQQFNLTKEVSNKFRINTIKINQDTFLAALSSSRSLVIGPSVRRSVRRSIGPSVRLPL